MCWRTGSQWSSRSTGMRWSNFLAPVTLGRPCSGWPVASAAARCWQCTVGCCSSQDGCWRTTVFADSSVSDDRTRRSWRSWNRHARDSAATWSAILSWLSTRTPRSDTTVENLTLADDRSSSDVDSLSSCCLVPSQIIWVLSAFILSRLLLIQASICSTHETKRWTTVDDNVAGAWCTLECRRHTSDRQGDDVEQLSGIQQKQQRAKNAALRHFEQEHHEGYGANVVMPLQLFVLCMF